MNTSSVSYLITPTAVLTPFWSNGGTRLTLTHDELAATSRYTVTVSAGSDLVSNPLDNAPYTWSFTTSAVSAAEADLALDIVRVGSGPVTAGGQITYTLVITNFGPTTPVTATLSDVFDDAAALAGVQGTGCVWTPGETDVICTVIAITDETPAHLTLVIDTSSTFSGTLSSSASVAPAEGVIDQNPGNDATGPLAVNVVTVDQFHIYLPLVFKNSQ